LNFNFNKYSSLNLKKLGLETKVKGNVIYKSSNREIIANIKSNFDEKLYYLSNLDNPKVSFFSDLKLTSIENLDRYNKIDKDIILLKKALIDLDKELIKSLSLDNNFTFNEIAKIYFYNLDINNFEFSESDRDNLNNFFIKAVDRLSNEKN